MIKVNRLNGEEVVVNADLIQLVGKRPDTVITLTNGYKIIVKESVGEIIDKVVDYKRRITTINIVKEEEEKWTSEP